MLNCSLLNKSVKMFHCIKISRLHFYIKSNRKVIITVAALFPVIFSITKCEYGFAIIPTQLKSDIGRHSVCVQVPGGGGACVVRGGICGERGMHGRVGVCGGGHAWQGSAWQGACVAGGGGASVQERRPLKQVVHILLECIHVDYFS